ncbi:MAG: heparinase II/III family protein [Bacteroidia bacterium]|nr:heparinase II/III family protein [Bacteroidia bacterium]
MHREWYKATTGHNAVLTDGLSQKEAGGTLLGYAANDSYAAVSAYAGPAFEGISHKRFLLLGPTYLLIVDELNSSDGKEHTFDWLYHNKRQSVSCDMPEVNGTPGELPAGYSYLKDIKSFKTDVNKPFSIKFINDKLAAHLTMPGSPGDIVFTGTGPLSSIVDRAPLVIVRRKGNLVRFISVLEPVLEGNISDVKTIEEMPGNTFGVKISRTESEDMVYFENGDPGKFSVKSKTSSGETLVLKSDYKE